MKIKHSSRKGCAQQPVGPIVGYFVGLQTLGLHMKKILLVVLTEMKQEMKIWGFLDFQYCSDP